MSLLIPRIKPPAPRASRVESMVTTLLSLAPCDESAFRLVNHSDAICALMSTLECGDHAPSDGGVFTFGGEVMDEVQSSARYAGDIMNLFGTDVSLTRGSDGAEDNIKNLISNNQDKVMNNLFSNLTNVNTVPTQGNKSLASIFSSTVINNNKKLPKEPKKAVVVPTPAPSIFLKGSKFDESSLPEYCQVIGSFDCSIESFIQILTRASKTRISMCLLWDTHHSSTNHMNTTSKLCTPSKPCNRWNCSCERNVRVKQSSIPLIGVFLLLADAAQLYYLSLNKDVSNVRYEERENLMCYILQSPTITKILYNNQVASLLLAQYLDPQRICNVFDPRIAAFLCDSDDSQEMLELNYLFQKHNISSVWSVPVTSSSAAATAKCVGSIYSELLKLLPLHKVLHQFLLVNNSMDVFSLIEMPLSQLLAVLELRGISISTNKFNNLEAKIKDKLKSTDASFSQLGLPPFNMNSPDQVGNLLYEVLKLPTPTTSTTSRIKHSTGEDCLLKIRHLHPVVDIILSHRSLVKLLGTYIDGYKGFIHSRDAAAKIHASWNQLSTRTGRLSCSSPNLQQLPNDQVILDEVFNVRQLFEPSHGSNAIFVSADYSQIEMRVLAHLSRDPYLIQLFSDTTASNDVYKSLASKIYQKSVIEVSKEEREIAKRTALGVIYGMSTYGVHKQLSIDIATATKISTQYLRQFPRVGPFIESCKKHAVKYGYVSTITNRRRHLPDIYSKDNSKRSAAERQAVNSVIQGSASDIIKYAMLAIEKEMERVYGAPSTKPRLLMQIHDELFYEVPITSDERMDVERDKFVHLLNHCMNEQLTRVLQFAVPLAAKFQYGLNWGDMIDIDVTESVTRRTTAMDVETSVVHTRSVD